MDLRNNAAVPVEIIRDSVDWVLFGAQVLSLIVTVVAVVLAALEIKLTRDDTRTSQKKQLKERRIDFELTVLRELLVAAHLTDVLRLKALAWTLPEEVVPITRAAAMLPTTEEGDRIVAQLPPVPGDTYLSSAYLNWLKDEVNDELVKAIEERVHERELIG